QVITLHDIADQLYPEWFNDRYVQWRSLILPSLLRRVKGIITVSQYSKQTILEQFPYTEGKINVIYNGVRLEHFYKRDAQEVKLLRDKYNRSEEHTSELQSRFDLVCRLLLEKKK